MDLMMGKTNTVLIQLNAILFLVGYLFIHAFLGVLSIGESHIASIAFDGVLVGLSLYVIFICSHDFLIERHRFFLFFFSILMMLYAFRMLMDIYLGPFAIVLPRNQMWNDMLQIVGAGFIPAWAMISSRKYLDIAKIANGVFWVGLLTCFMLLRMMMSGGLNESISEERLELGGSLHTLALARLGAIEVIAALHLLLNNKKGKIVYVLGIILGVYIALASGSRGGVVGLAIALGLLLVMSMRKKPVLFVLSVLIVTVFVLSIVPFLNWLGHYFPVISNRMLDTVVEGDLSNRDLIYDMAFDRIMENPIWGYGYRLKPDATGYGPHNGILDVVLCLGIPMGVLFTVVVYGFGSLFAIRMMIDKGLIFPSLMAMFALISSISGSSLPMGSFDFSVVLVGVAYYYHFKRPKPQFNTKSGFNFA